MQRSKRAGLVRARGFATLQSCKRMIDREVMLPLLCLP